MLTHWEYIFIRCSKDGGTHTKDVIADDAKTPKKTPTDLEQVSFHNNSIDAYREFYHSFCAVSVVDFTPLSENAAVAALVQDLPYIGIAFNEYHCDVLRAQITDRVFQGLTDPECSFYEPLAVAELSSDQNTEEDEDAAPIKKKNPKPNPTKKNPNKPTPKKTEAKPKPKSAKKKGKKGKEGAETEEAELEDLLNGLENEESEEAGEKSEGGSED